jgi:hypothetical protein
MMDEDSDMGEDDDDEDDEMVRRRSKSRTDRQMEAFEDGLDPMVSAQWQIWAYV